MAVRGVWRIGPRHDAGGRHDRERRCLAQELLRERHVREHLGDAQLLADAVNIWGGHPHKPVCFNHMWDLQERHKR